MNKSGIILINFKIFIKKYLDLRPGSFSSKGETEANEETYELSIAYLEQNLSFISGKREWLAVKLYPELGTSLNPNYLDEDPLLEILHLN